MKPSKKNVKSSKKKSSNSSFSVSSTPIPSARSFSVVPKAPVITTKGRITRITGQEMWQTISGSVVFSSTRYEINPGLEGLAWLSERSQGYEKYRWRRLRLHYIPAEAVTTSPGVVILAADYDPEDRRVESLQKISAYSTVKNGRVFEHVTLDIPVDRMFDDVQWKKVRIGPVKGDLQLYDGCGIVTGTVSCSGTAAIGQLWVEYDLELKNPQADASTPNCRDVVAFSKTTTTAFTTGVPQTVDWNDWHIVGFSGVSEASGVITLPPGTYRVTFNGSVTFSGASGGLFRARILVDGSAHADAHAAIAGAQTQGIYLEDIVQVIGDASTRNIELECTGTFGAGTCTLGNTWTENRFIIEIL